MPSNASMAVREAAAAPEVAKGLSAAEREWIFGAGARLLRLSELQARVLTTCLQAGSFTLDDLGGAVGASKQAVYGVLTALKRRGLLELTPGVREGRYSRRGVVAGPALEALLRTVEESPSTRGATASGRR